MAQVATSEERGGARAGPRAAVYWGLWAACLALYAWIHVRMGFRVPTPWPDEGSFLWQAIAFARDATLFAPELNPEQPILWMPPGFLVWSGSLFALTGFSFGWARTLSCLYVMGAMTCVAALVRRGSLPFAGLALTGFALLSHQLLLVGNIARMESLLLLQIFLALLFLARGRFHGALALAATAPLVHPNGGFALAGVGVAWAVALWRGPARRRPAGWEVLLLAAAAAAWVAYAAYVIPQWALFREQMAYQLSLKNHLLGTAGGTLVRLLEPMVLLSAAVLAVGAVHAVRTRAATWPLLVYAVPLQFQVASSLGWNYEVFPVVLGLLVGVIAVEVLYDLLGRLPVGLVRARRSWVCAVFCALLVALAFPFVESDAGDTPHFAAGWAGRHVDAAPPYLPEEEAVRVRAFLEALPEAPEPWVVPMIPFGDALFFADLSGDRLRLSQPTLYEERGDLWLAHESPALSPFLLDLSDRIVRKHLDGSDLPDGWPALVERDGEKRWSYRWVNPPRPNVVLVTVDTLRADHLEPWGYERATSPAIARLAEEGVRFSRAVSQAPWTLPSMATLHTALYPSEHGATGATRRLDPSHRTLAEALREAGYTTLGVVSHNFVDESRGFAQGFDRFDESQILPHDASNSPQLTEIALGLLRERNPARPFFLWVHYFDPHYTYVRHEEFDFAAGSPPGIELNIIRLRELIEARDDTGAPVLQPEHVEYVRGVYDEEIAYTDAAIGVLVDGVRASVAGSGESTLFFLTADHGEFFMERGSFGHDEASVHQALVHVPLVIAGDIDPDLRARVIDSPVEVASLARTISGVAGVPAAVFPGRDLLALARRGGGDTAAFTEASFAWGDHDEGVAVLVGEWKLVHNRTRGAFALYHLASDPEERVDRWDDPDAEARAARERLAGLLAEFRPRSGQRPAEVVPDPEVEERLRSLGYLE